MTQRSIAVLTQQYAGSADSALHDSFTLAGTLCIPVIVQIVKPARKQFIIDRSTRKGNDERSVARAYNTWMKKNGFLTEGDYYGKEKRWCAEGEFADCW